MAITYNTQKNRLIIPEYGRNVQMLVEHAKGIEDKAERQKFADALIQLMGRISPGNKNLDDQKTRLWNHLFQIASHDIDVEIPEGVEMLEKGERIRPKRIPYPSKSRNNRHYGTKIKAMIDRAIALEDEEKKKAFCVIIASYMKTAYRNWSGNHVTDEIIKKELVKMSDGKLELDDDVVLDNPSHNRRRRPNNNYRSNNNGRRNNNKNSNYSRNNNNRKRRK